jgi:hypothetical protein
MRGQGDDCRLRLHAASRLRRHISSFKYLHLYSSADSKNKRGVGADKPRRMFYRAEAISTSNRVWSVLLVFANVFE